MICCCSWRSLALRLLPVIAALSLCLLPSSSATIQSSIDDQARDEVLAAFEIADFDLIDLAIPDSPEDLPLDQVSVGGILIDGVYWTLDLNHHSMRAEDYRLIVQDPDGSYRDVESLPSTTYRGVVRGMEGSSVAASIRNGQLTARILIGNQGWAVEPSSSHNPNAPIFSHVIYPDEMVRSSGECGVDAMPGRDVIGQRDFEGFTGGTTLVTTKRCEIAFDADVEFYNQNGGSVPNTENDIENVLNAVDAIYERDCNIVYSITTIIVRTSEPDPYTSRDAPTLLSQFAGEWNGNQAGIHRDVAHLMTGKNINGGTIGIAFLAAICNTGSAYGLSQSRFTGNFTARVGLTAHELGHNWSANHCSGADCRIMCAILGYCAGDLTRFGAQSIGSITSFRDSRACLDAGGVIAPLPFVENWPTTTFSDQRWSYHPNITINSAASNEPSPPNSVNLDSNDELRSVGLAMGGVNLARITYSVEARGPEAGESLVFEGLDEDGDWIEIDRVTSNGAIEDNFTTRSFYLPESFYYDGLCIRFRSESSDTGDEWYIDDILVEDRNCPAPLHYGNPTPGTGGVLPEISSDGGVPFIGNSNFRLKGRLLYGSAPAFLFVGFSQQVVQLGSGLWLNTLPPWFVVSFVTSGLPLPGQGTINIPAPIPFDPFLDGIHLTSFMISQDAGGAGGFNGTDGLDAQICQ